MKLAPITIRVGSGNWIPADANIFWNVGITKISSTAMAIVATDMITPG